MRGTFCCVAMKVAILFYKIYVILFYYEGLKHYEISYKRVSRKSQAHEVILNGEFEPKIVPKNTRDVSGIEDKIILLYAKWLTIRDINEQIQELYGIEVSATMVSNITDQIIPEIKEWRKDL